MRVRIAASPSLFDDHSIGNCSNSTNKKMGNREILFIAGGMVNWLGGFNMESIRLFLKNLGIELPRDPIRPFLGIETVPHATETLAYPKPMLIARLLTIIRKRSQPRCL